MTAVTVRTECSVEGCDRGGRIARGLCRAHYDYMRAHGTTDIPAERKTYKHVHTITAIDIERRVADCAGCGPNTAVSYRLKSDRGYWVCRNGGSWRGGFKTPESRRKYAIKFKFGISVAEYDALLAKQGGMCAICALPCSSGRNLAVDHDHDTGQIRGLLCGHCNTAIGLLGDNPARLRAAIAYLS